jgi:hypothetical protein
MLYQRNCAHQTKNKRPTRLQNAGVQSYSEYRLFLLCARERENTLAPDVNSVIAEISYIKISRLNTKPMAHHPLNVFFYLAQ